MTLNFEKITPFFKWFSLDGTEKTTRPKHYTSMWNTCTRKPWYENKTPIHTIVDLSRNKIWYLFSVLLVITSAHQQTNGVQHYDGRHCTEHRSVSDDVEFLENRRKIDRVRWNEERRCEVIPWGIFTITDRLPVVCLRG